MSSEPFFVREGDGFQPQPVCAGPWDPTSLHGRVVAGLFAAEIERAHGDPELMPARMTVDLYRLPGFLPLRVESTVIREGRRIRVVNAEMFSGEKSVGRASVQFLRRSQDPDGTVWKPAVWDVPPPADISPPERSGLGGMWRTLQISGMMGTVGARRCWISEARAMIEGEALTPWQRVALAADFSNPYANAGDAGLRFINTDITLYLHRLPMTEWIGFEVIAHQSADGIANGVCALYDESGHIGSSTVAALAQH
ncbi:MAG: thioesterase family protein [Pseudomonadales bacterium]|nr:thioesterase family protein [Pseudomonadales bacterium]MDP7358975.1 thioesterase family protein [Pseudomonadales bacterium]MDP7595778.1 thioesterase family protein [Pseudomonadales bacterium]HJN48894.1 thioesterase family protein [Pseudomonadales bacterium]